MNVKNAPQLETKDLARKAAPASAPSHASAVGGGDDAPKALDQLLNLFEEYRQVNDERLEAIERKAQGDVLVDEKLARMDAAIEQYTRRMDEMSLKHARPSLGGKSPDIASLEAKQHTSAFRSYMRSGDEGALLSIEQKGYSASVPRDGGYMVPEQVEAQILSRLEAVSPMRSICSTLQVAGNAFRKLTSETGPVTGWVGEGAARPETASSALADLSFQTMELYAMPAASQTLLDDAAINVDEWIAAEVEGAFAEQETDAFIAGDGLTMPKGLLSYTTVDDATWSWGNIGTINTGANGAFASANPGDALIDLIYAVKARYRQNGTFMMNRNTQAALRKLKDGQGNYLWQPPVVAGGNASLLGYPIVEVETMPDFAASSTPIAFGDFKRGYLIVDRLGVRVLRDPYSSKPNVLFYTTKRVGGGVQDFDAIKLLKAAV
ncbi:phage major capsid protein [Rhodobacteraceae bacterium RKSG542]|uniref:phage major capsid protein n=1 Tax=Pseudovibrio flavus TaxID=2529854 RepID=UPI0012BD60BA|nr:phage major capsid protein [Pseudovibrio flavus]MTI17062.1 phage major capsid protein [Pseudovibrio flavus]